MVRWVSKRYYWRLSYLSELPVATSHASRRERERRKKWEVQRKMRRQEKFKRREETVKAWQGIKREGNMLRRRTGCSRQRTRFPDKAPLARSCVCSSLWVNLGFCRIKSTLRVHMVAGNKHREKWTDPLTSWSQHLNVVMSLTHAVPQKEKAGGLT